MRTGTPTEVGAPARAGLAAGAPFFCIPGARPHRTLLPCCHPKDRMNIIATASTTGAVAIWDIESRSKQVCARGGGCRAKAPGVAPCARLTLGPCARLTVDVCHTPQACTVIQAHNRTVNTVSFVCYEPDGLLSGSQDRCVMR